MSVSASISSGSLRRSPYQGLTPYGEDDAPYFFGREKEARLIVANLFASPLTLLYGASGVGKSSVLRAGVAHQLRKRDDVLVVVFNSWQRRPLADLIQTVSHCADLADHRAWSEAVRQLPQNHTSSLPEFLAVCAEKLGRRLLIILDQFEEYFLYHSQNDDFGTEFPKAVKQSNAPVSFLISIREDFYAKLDRFEGRIPTLYDNYLRIEHLDRAAARVAIEKPIEEYNCLHSNGHKRFSIEPELVQAVLRQVETGQVILGETGRGVVETTKPSEDDEAQIETPYLQLVMTKLWDEEIGQHSGRLRLRTLNDLGGAENIVRCHLDAVMSGLLPQEQQIAASMFHYLVTPSGTKIAYSAVDLAGSANLEEQEVVRVLEKLANGDIRIIRPVDAPADGPTAVRYEIFHDVLAPAILTWRTGYVQALEREEAQRRAEEERQHAEEQARIGEQARVAGRLRRLSSALAVVTLLVLGFAVYAWSLRAKAVASENAAVTARNRAEDAAENAILEKGRADEQRRRANNQAVIAEVKAAEANKARADADAQRMIALEEKQRADQQAAISASRELAAAANSNLSSDPELSVLLGIEALSKLSYSRSLGNVVTETDEKEAKSALHEAILTSRVRHKIRFNQSEGRDPSGSGTLHFSSDAKRMVTVDGNGIATVLDPVTGKKWLLQSAALERVNLAALSPDGSWFAAAGPPSAESSSVAKVDSAPRTEVVVWDVATGKSFKVSYESRLGNLWHLSFVNGGKTLVLVGNVRDPEKATGSATLQLWDIEERRAGALYDLNNGPVSRPPTYIAFSSDAKRILTFDGNDQATVWEAASRRALRTITASDAALSPDGKQVAGISDGSDELKVWEVDSGKMVRSFCAPECGECPGRFEKPVFSPDGKNLAASSMDNGIVRVWDVASGRTIVTTPGYSSNEIALRMTTLSLSRRRRPALRPTFSFSADGRLFAAYGGLGTVKVWSASSGTEFFNVAGHKSDVTAIAFSPSSQHLITGTDDGIARVWDATRSHEVITISRLVEVDNVTYSPDGAHLAGSLKEGGIGVWDTKTWTMAYTVPISKTVWGRCVAYSRDGKLLAVADEGGYVTLVEAGSGRVIEPPLKLANTTVHEVAFSPDGKRLAAAAGNAGAYVVDMQDRKRTKPAGIGVGVISVAFSPNGKYLATGSADGTATIWDARTYNRLRILKEHHEAIWRVVFSPDSKRIATASHDSSVKIWDAASGAKLLELSGHHNKVWGVAFSPRGKYIATTSSDLTTKIWDAKNGEELLTLTGHRQTINQAAFSPDESRLATCSDDGTIRVYILDSKELVELAKARISGGRELEPDERKKYLHQMNKK